MTDLHRLQRLADGGDADAARRLLRLAVRDQDGDLIRAALPLVESIDPALAPLLAWHCDATQAPRVFAALPRRGYALEARRLTFLCLQAEDAEIMVIESRSPAEDARGRGVRPHRARPLLSARTPNGLSGHPSLARYWIDPHGAQVPLLWGRAGLRQWLAACCLAAAADEIAPWQGGEHARAMLRAAADVLAQPGVLWRGVLWSELSAAAQGARMMPLSHLRESIMHHDGGARRGYGPLHLAGLLRSLSGTPEGAARMWAAQRRALASVMAAPPTPIERAAGNPAWQPTLFEVAP